MLGARNGGTICLSLAYLLCLGNKNSQANEQSLRILFVGDIMLDGGPGHIITNDGDPFASVASTLSDSDITIGNLECAITKKGKAVEKPYTFKGPALALQVLRKHFSAVSLANNHSGDWGKLGFSGELDLLRDARLPWFGGGSNIREARRPLILTRNGQRIALLGYNEFPPQSFAATNTEPGVAWLIENDVVEDIRKARQQPADRIILFLHWGIEYESNPTKKQQALARRLIDAGADAVIGSHPHVTQTIDWYKNRPIVYSLANFVFDYYPNDPPLFTGWIVRLTFGKEQRPTLEKLTVELDPAGVPHLSSGK
jgi:poly-gamma-glutamate synthesis protein (capsule biosynthesis protein)